MMLTWLLTVAVLGSVGTVVAAGGFLLLPERPRRAMLAPLLGYATGMFTGDFFETVVRVHRAGEGAPFTGLKPAGLDVGPVIPVAEQAVKTGPRDLVELLTAIVREETWRRFAHLAELARHAGGDVETARPYVQAMLDLEVWAHGVYLAATGQPHEDHPAASHVGAGAHTGE